MKKKLLFLAATPMLFFVLAFQGSCRSQCEEMRRVVREECKEDLGANSERCQQDQKLFQEMCRDELASN